MSGQRLPVSVVVAVKDEEGTITELLSSISAQSVLPDEVVIVDGGSADRTGELLKELAARDPHLTVVTADGPATPGRGRNLGIAAARNEWIAITDAGITVAETWLEQLWESHVAHPDAEVVYGSFEFQLRSFFEECAAVAYCLPRRSTPAGPLRGPAIVSCLVHRHVFPRTGGFVDSRSGEDEIFIRSVGDLDLPVAWAPDATVWWQLRPDFASTFERFRLYSFHYVLAGQQEHWHRRMARGYVPVAAGIALAASSSPRWFALAAAPVAARVALRLHRHAEGRGLRWQLRPDRVALVGAIMLANDAATALGWWQAKRSIARTGPRARRPLGAARR